MNGVHVDKACKVECDQPPFFLPFRGCWMRAVMFAYKKNFTSHSIEYFPPQRRSQYTKPAMYPAATMNTASKKPRYGNAKGMKENNAWVKKTVSEYFPNEIKMDVNRRVFPSKSICFMHAMANKLINPNAYKMKPGLFWCKNKG